MESNSFWVKNEVFRHAVFPQLPSFCGIAACSGVVGAILGQRMTEQTLHARYAVGSRTKLHVPAFAAPEAFAHAPRSGPGFSNWDIIRLFNAVMLDEGRAPSSALLCGDDLVRVWEGEAGLEPVLAWLRGAGNQAIVHLVNHYTILAGVFGLAGPRSTHAILADSSLRNGPLRSFSLQALADLARQDGRYGLVLLSDSDLPDDLFERWTDSMFPSEARLRQRFVRIDTSA